MLGGGFDPFAVNDDFGDNFVGVVDGVGDFVPDQGLG